MTKRTAFVAAALCAVAFVAPANATHKSHSTPVPMARPANAPLPFDIVDLTPTFGEKRCGPQSRYHKDWTVCHNRTN